MRLLKILIALVFSSAMLSGCEKKESKKKDENPQTTTQQPSPPAPQTEKNPPPPQTNQNQTNQTDNANQKQPNATSPQNPAKQPPQVAMQRLPPPPPPLTREQQIENALPPVSPLDTFGGQLLQSYLSGAITGEQAIAQIFETKDLIMSNLAEMSMAVRALQEQGRYSSSDQEKVLVLEGAATQFLNEKIRSNEIRAASLEYGTAVALGIVGGVYSGQIIDALKRLGSSPIVQSPLRGIQYVYESAAGSPAAISAWLRNRWSGKAAQEVADTSATAVENGAPAGLAPGEAETISQSSNLYRRAVGFVAAPVDAAARERMVFNHIYRVINSPQLAKGYSVSRIADRSSRLAEVEKLEFTRTGIPGFRIHRDPESDYFIAQLITRGGVPEYYRVTGQGIRAVTTSGQPLDIPAKGTIGLASDRLKQWGDNTAALMRNAGYKSKQYVSETRPYQYLTSDPFGQRLVQGAAVGVPIAATTLLAIHPLNTKYLTLDDYVRELQADGVKVDQFIDTQRERAAKGRR